jgi:hypothetical protein
VPANGQVTAVVRRPSGTAAPAAGAGRLRGVEWSPRPAGTVARLVAAAVLAGAAVLLVRDPPGRLLVGLAALGLLVAAGHDVLVRPRLAARPEGVVARTWTGSRRLPWPALRVRVRATRRLGLVVRTLELDAEGPADDGTLVVLGRRDVGRPVDDVARQLRALRQETLG